ncbi:MAG: hypothetical protein ACTSRW_01855 [Candidatus Helarchaeota archaeon]
MTLGDLFNPFFIFYVIVAISGAVLLFVVIFNETQFEDLYLVPISVGVTFAGLGGAIIFLTFSSVVLAIVLSIVFGIGTCILFVFVRRQFESTPSSFKEFEGLTATVEIPIIGNKIGRIIVDNPSTETVEGFPAKAIQAMGEYRKGEKVLIVKLEGSIAYVSK